MSNEQQIPITRGRHAPLVARILAICPWPLCAIVALTSFILARLHPSLLLPYLAVMGLVIFFPRRSLRFALSRRPSDPSIQVTEPELPAEPPVEAERPLESDEPATVDSVEPPAKPRRSRRKARPKEAATPPPPPTAVAWVRVGPGKFVRIETPDAEEISTPPVEDVPMTEEAVAPVREDSSEPEEVVTPETTPLVMSQLAREDIAEPEEVVTVAIEASEPEFEAADVLTTDQTIEGITEESFACPPIEVFPNRDDLDSNPGNESSAEQLPAAADPPSDAEPGPQDGASTDESSDQAKRILGLDGRRWRVDPRHSRGSRGLRGKRGAWTSRREATQGRVETRKMNPRRRSTRGLPPGKRS